MKKKAFIIFCLLLVVLGVFSAVSAQRLDDPEYYTKIPQSKPEFYGSISECLSRIQAGLEEGNRKKANLGIYDLRWNVYQCAIYLLRTDQYDVRIYDVIYLAYDAFDHQDELDTYIGYARSLAWEILMDDVYEEGDTGGGSHS